MSFQYILQETRSHNNTLILKDEQNQQELKMHSAYDPVKEARRSVQKFNPGKASIIIVSGLGLAYHVKEIQEAYPNKTVIVAESDRKIIEKCLQNDHRSLEKISIISSSRDIEIIFNIIDLSKFTGIAHFAHRQSLQINKEFYTGILDEIKIFISSKVSDLLTRFEFEQKWIKNIFKNINFLSNSIGVKNFFGQFKGRPGIIVSAGPSLKININELEKLKDRAVIVAVDTALKVLHRHSIEPHFVMTLDAQKYSQKHFNGVPTNGTILLADIVCCHSVLRTFKGRKAISTTSKYYENDANETTRETTPAMDWIEKYMAPFGDIQSGGSVATSAFDFLLNAGCSKIILLGQDLAYTGREIHCSGTYHNDDWQGGMNRLSNLDSINQNIIRRRKTKHVQAYGGKKRVISDFVFDLYKSWFEDSSYKIGIDVINSSQGGSRIKNTLELPLSQFTTEKNLKSTWEIIDNIYKESPVIPKDGVEKLICAARNSFLKVKKAMAAPSWEEKSLEEINGLIYRESLSQLIDPLLRKTNIYISRNNLDPIKSKEILIKEIDSISDFYLALLNNSYNSINLNDNSKSQKM